VTDEELGMIMHCMGPEEATETLVDLANLRGGPDNISVVIAQVNDAVPKAAVLETTGEMPTEQRWPVTPLLLLAALVCFVTFMYCVGNHLWTGAIGSAVGFLAAIGGSLAFRSSSSAMHCPPIQSIGGPYGNGPYRKAACTPNGKFVATLADIAAKLRELADKDTHNRVIDWAAFEKAQTAAIAAAERGDFTNAIREYSAAIRGIMRQLRNGGPTIDVVTDGK
jgi:protein phosphatase